MPIYEYYCAGCGLDYEVMRSVSQSNEPAKGSPVLSVEGVEFSPLEIAWALLAGEVEGGLVGFFADLEAERLTRPRE